MQLENGKIYKITNTENDKLYIGSTTKTLSRRLSNHKSYCSKSNQLIHKAMLNLGIDKFKIELIENFPCDRKEDLERREGYYIKKLNTLAGNGYNRYLPGRTKEEKRAYNMAYKLTKTTCECGTTLCRNHMARHLKRRLHAKRMKLISQS